MFIRLLILMTAIFAAQSSFAGVIGLDIVNRGYCQSMAQVDVDDPGTWLGTPIEETCDAVLVASVSGGASAITEQPLSLPEPPFCAFICVQAVNSPPLPDLEGPLRPA